MTPRGEGGIAVIEVTGPDAVTTLDRLFQSPRGIRAAQLLPGQMAYGKLWRAGEFLDEVVLDCVETTGEPFVAVNCHGGAMATRRILRALKVEGIGEVTWREMPVPRGIGGNLDAISVEAATRVPHAPTLLASGVLLDQYAGALSRTLTDVRDALMAEQNWDCAAKELAQLLATASFGRGLCDHARLVIAGRPNIGKSTLANALLRFDRMIVHHIPGTTRDAIEEVFSIDGMPFLLVDTAGMREAKDEIEREGVQRGKAEIGRADALILVFDGSEPLTAEDRMLLEGQIPPRAIPVINKCDLTLAIEEEEIRTRFEQPPVRITATRDEGIKDLEGIILKTAYPLRPSRDDPVVFTVRQEQGIRAALCAVEKRDAQKTVRCIERILSGE